MIAVERVWSWQGVGGGEIEQERGEKTHGQAQ